MQEVLMVLALGFALDDGHFEHWESVDSQLKEEINLKLSPFFRGPVGVVFVDFGTLATTSNNWGEPILVPKKDEGHDGRKRIKQAVITEFKNINGFPVPDFSLVLHVDQFVYSIPHHVVVTIFCYLRFYLSFT